MMVTTTASPASPGVIDVGNEPNEYDKIPVKDKKRFDFLMGLYPKGREVNDIIDQAIRVFKCTKEIAEREVKKELYDYQNEKLVNAATRKDGSIVVFLTKQGSEKIFTFLELLRKHNKEKFFVYVKSWIRQGDESAANLYNNEMTKLFLDKPHITCMLMLPHFENDIVNEYAKYLGKQPDGEVASIVLKYLGLLQTMKLVGTKVETVSGRSHRFYYLTPRGKETINMVFKQLSNYISMPGKVEKIAKTHPRMMKRGGMYLFSLLFAFIAIMVTWASRGEPHDPAVLLIMIFSASIPVVFMLVMEFLLPRLIARISKHGA